jgi:hypothetical protein
VTEEGPSSFTGDDLAKLCQKAESRAEIHETQSSRFLFGGRDQRVVMCIRDIPALLHSKCVLKFADVGNLFLHLEPL